MTPNESLISIQTLRLAVDYNASSGALTWRRRNDDFPSGKRNLQSWNTRFAGQSAFGLVSKKGYQTGYLLGLHLFSHRVAWAIHHGAWPDGQIDHVNGNKSDNRICNLRVVTARGNAKNRPLRADNSSGQVGVYWVPKTNRWMAQIKVNGKQVTIGRYQTLEAATAARKNAEQLHDYHPNHGRQV